MSEDEQQEETTKAPFELTVLVGNKKVTKKFWSGVAAAQWFETQKQSGIPETPEWLAERPKRVKEVVKKKVKAEPTTKKKK